MLLNITFLFIFELMFKLLELFWAGMVAFYTYTKTLLKNIYFFLGFFFGLARK